MLNMVISKEALRSYNKGKELTFNEGYNKAQKLGTRKEGAFLNKVAYYKYGLFNGQLTTDNIKEYLNSLTTSEAEAIAEEYKELFK